MTTRTSYKSLSLRDRISFEKIRFCELKKRLAPICGSFVKPFALLCLFPCVIKALEFSLPYLVGKAAESFHYKIETDLFWCMAGIVIAYSLHSILMTIQWNSYCKYVYKPLEKEAMYASEKKMHELSFGRIQAQFEEDREIIQKGRRALVEGLYHIYTHIVPATIGLVIGVACFFFIHELIGTVSLLCFVLYAAVSFRIDSKFLRRIKTLSKRESMLDKTLGEKMKNTISTVLYGQQEAELADMVTVHRRAAKHHRLLWSKYTWRMTKWRQPVAVVCLMILLLISAMLAFTHEISPPNFLIVMWWSTWMFSLISSVSPVQRDLMEGWGHVGAFLDFLDILPRADPIGEPRIPGKFRGLRVSGACYKRPTEPVGGKWALENVSFEIEHGEVVAFVGPSGSGKSTMFNLILGSYFAQLGRVWVKGDELAVDMRQISLEWWWDQIGYVPQKPILWNRSMVDNILYGRKSVSQEKFVWAMKAARLYDDFYLTGKMNNLVGEDGCKLSGGERQRVAIATALMREPKVLLFDEAMSGLDNENEALVLESILDLSKEVDESGNKKYTILIIAHKTATAANADRIIVLSDRTITAIGKHSELRKSCALYRKLAGYESRHPFDRENDADLVA